MKLFMGCLSVLLLTGFANAKEKSNETKNSLKGKVKSCIETAYEAKNISGKMEKGKITQNKIVSTYNNQGKIIEQNSYNTDGSLSFKYIVKYDDKGKKIGINQYNADGGLLSQKIYDSKENLLESKEYFSSDGSVTGNMTLHYDEKGHLIELKEHNVNGTFTYTYRYDDSGNRIEEKAYVNGHLEKTKTVTYRYNKKGNIIEKIYAGNISFKRYDDNGHLIEERYSPDFTSGRHCAYQKVMKRCGHSGCGAESYCTYQYDDRGNRIKANCNGEQIIYRYDSNNNEIEESCGSPSHKPWYQSIHQYDDKNNLIKEKRIENDTIGKDRSYRYLYDKQGNWIKKITFEKDIPQLIEERQFTYYK